MAKHTVLAALIRERAGKGAARATRREGRVPAVVYGNKTEPLLISIDPLQLNQEMRKSGFFGHVFDIELGTEKFAVLPRDIQFHPLTDRPIHADFLRFSAETRVHVEVPVLFQNEAASPGLKRGGVLNTVRRTIELVCSPESIPENIVVDLTGLDIGSSIHISHVKLPEGVESAISDRDFTIATIAAPSVEVIEKAAGEEEEMPAAPTAEPASTEE
jgi:large subunit ribosomal protein L25